MPSDEAGALPRPLIDRFVRHLSDVHAEVSAAEAELHAAAAYERPAVIERLRDLAHRLAGTAQGYGFAELGVSARALEQIICADSAPETVLADRLSDFNRRLAAAASQNAG